MKNRLLMSLLSLLNRDLPSNRQAFDQIKNSDLRGLNVGASRFLVSLRFMRKCIDRIFLLCRRIQNICFPKESILSKMF